jgi:hypothetical protein
MELKETEVSDENWQEEYPFQDGKTLRDEFAMRYMEGCVTRNRVQRDDFHKFAKVCYELADVMMKVR